MTLNQTFVNNCRFVMLFQIISRIVLDIYVFVTYNVSIFSSVNLRLTKYLADLIICSFKGGTRCIIVTVSQLRSYLAIMIQIYSSLPLYCSLNRVIKWYHGLVTFASYTIILLSFLIIYPKILLNMQVKMIIARFCYPI